MRVKETAREDDGERQEIVLTITATTEEVKQHTDKFFKDLSQRNVPGFRKGKAPRTVLEKGVGGHDNAMAGIGESIVNELAMKAIDNADVIFIDEPQFNVDKLPVEGKPWHFTVSGPVAPIMKLTDYGPVSVEMPPEQATDEEIDDQIKTLQEYYHSFEDITDPDHEAAPGDYMMAEISVDNHGKTISGLRNTSRMIGLGEGVMPPTFDEKIYGAKVGTTLDFNFDVEVENEDGPFGDGHLHAYVIVKSFRKRVLPEIDDALANKIGCMDVDDLYKQMRFAINQHKAKELPKLLVDRVIDQLITRLDGEVPQYYVDFIQQDVGREFMQELDKKGTNLQQYILENNADGEKMKEEIAAEAKRRAEIECALEAMFVEKEMKITKKDINKLFEGEEGKATLKEWEDANRMANVRKMARQQKVTEWLVDTADVTIVDEDISLL